jgi:hypothetical protein
MGYFDCIFGKELWVNPMGFFCNALGSASSRRLRNFGSWTAAENTLD